MNLFTLLGIDLSECISTGSYAIFCWKNFPQFVVTHTVKGFSVVNEAEVGVVLEFSYFCYNPTDVDNLISGNVMKYYQL